MRRCLLQRVLGMVLQCNKLKMMAAGGYPWLVIPVEEKDEYMAALEAASVEGDIGPFVESLGSLIDGENSHNMVLNRATTGQQLATMD